MKIDRLYTLSQFVDLTKKYINDVSPKGICFTVDSIFRYNNFLKQPLKKEMFVNEIEKPKHLEDWKQLEGKASYVQEELQKVVNYQEAEKKVIFDHASYDIHLHPKNTNIIIIKGFEFVLDEHTLNDVAERLKGYDVKLKNVEI